MKWKLKSISLFFYAGIGSFFLWLSSQGTVIAALLVGFVDRLIGKKLAFLKDMIFPETAPAESEIETKEQTAGIKGYIPEFIKK